MITEERENRIEITTKDIALIGVMTATISAAKMALSVVPNVELVTLLIILYALVFGRRVFYAVAVFVLLEGCLYGFGIWWAAYVYIWPLLAALAFLFRKREAVWFWSIFAGGYGLIFGALCAVPYFIVDGWHAAMTWWVAGIPYDLLHCVSNVVLCRILFGPLYRVLRKLQHQLQS